MINQTETHRVCNFQFKKVHAKWKVAENENTVLLVVIENKISSVSTIPVFQVLSSQTQEF